MSRIFKKIAPRSYESTVMSLVCLDVLVVLDVLAGTRVLFIFGGVGMGAPRRWWRWSGWKFRVGKGRFGAPRLGFGVANRVKDRLAKKSEIFTGRCLGIDSNSNTADWRSYMRNHLGG